ncbi:type II toxin-antitoxin system RelE/ParE family toxin [Devosia sp. YR412]|uniref:type II toxin-antitoxin system RelE family toxin n=1 Tax=Devosia sp. YR412 TaxID=1881030 RepID=UPI001FCD0745|nr:type II toxin-antitoxin system RelE/ParE family toxin [Devosia sp. YR412]
MNRLPNTEQLRIRSYFNEVVATSADARSIGAALKRSRFGELWRYRVGDYPIICQIIDARLVVLVLETGHRSAIYRAR